jgi:hypothetical protein
MSSGIVLLVLAQGLAGCGGAGSSPSPVPPPIRLVVFTDGVSGLSTSDVRDVQDQIVRFNTAAEAIWTADDTRFPGYVVNGSIIRANVICASCVFLVRFGTKDGERRAYLTFPDNEDHTNAVTILDVEVVDGRLVITNTNVRVPGS